MSKPYTVGSLFSGIGGLDLAAHWAGLNNPANQWDCGFYSQQFLSFDYASMNQSMTIRAKNNPILNGQFPSRCFGLNVMGIATRFIPTANHAFIRIQPSHGFIPTALVGINPLASVNIGYPTIPNHRGAVSAKIFKSSLFLLISHLSVLMPSQVKLLSAFFIIFRAHCPASTSASNHFHSLSSFPSLGEKIISYLSPNKYPELREK